jgi:predicted AAA+ superfamily ATPase
MTIKLSGLSFQNAWWKGEGWEKNDNDLKELDILLDRKKIEIKKGEIYLLRGIRRSGKTVYTKLLIKDLVEKIDGRKIIYVSCDRHNLSEIKNIIREFVKRFNGEVAIFDEITYFDGFREFIGNVVDIKDKIENPDIRKIIGKIKKFDSFPLLNPNIEDMIPYFDELESLFYSYILTGGFPDAVLQYLKKGKINEKMYETIIRLFLGTLSNENKSEEIGREILEKILNSKTSRLDFITIASDTGIHHNTVREYIEILENSRVIYLLPAWDINKKRYSLRKQKKIIFQSSLIPQALYQYITGCTYYDILDFVDKNLEVLVEQIVSSHIIQGFEKPVIKERHAFAGFYYNTKECDLLISNDKKFYGFEIKYGKPKKQKYPFPVSYITKDVVDEESYPAPLFLAGIKKSGNTI